MLQQAVTWPAKFIRANGAGEFPAERYEEIFAEIIDKVKIHGPAPEQMHRRSAYILKAVQDHWRHHWERYADESKAAARTVDSELRALRKTSSAAQPSAMEILATAHDALRTGRPRGRKTTTKGKGPAEIPPACPRAQAELF